MMRRGRMKIPVPALLMLAVLVGGCSYFVGDVRQVVPKPTEVRVQQPPTINSCEAEFVLIDEREHYEQVCDWCWDPWCYPCICCGWCGCYYWCCWNEWRWTDVRGDILLRLVVTDPSGDLDQAKSPRVRVLDSRLGTPGTCLLVVRATDIVVQSTDIVGGGQSKVVNVRLRNVEVRFTRECRTYTARIPLRLVFTDCGREMVSTNECEATLTLAKQ